MLISLSIGERVWDIGAVQNATKKATKDAIKVKSLCRRPQPYIDVILEEHNGAKQFYLIELAYLFGLKLLQL